MIGRVLPRYLILAAALTLVVIGAMLSLFYGQYRWLATDIVARSVEEHDAILEGSFEGRARAQLHRIADSVAASVDQKDSASISLLLEDAIIDNDNLAGLRYMQSGLSVVQAGDIPENIGGSPTQWATDNLYLTYPVRLDDDRLGKIIGNFSLAELRRESVAFRDQLLSRGDERRRTSFVRIGIATLVVLALCGGVLWIIIKSQSTRIRALKVQAEKLSDADYGEPLQVLHGDELGDLAEVFNKMREKLKRTTISRDYVDNVLSSMNEAIIVTSADGSIERINNATAKMLDYSELELVGQPLDFIIDRSKSRVLESESPSGIPREAFLLAKSGDSVPVSYTASVIRGGAIDSEGRVFAAQNITERRRAEQRIRYLARIDALTKVPNRMQFQHLLQRGIARARRSKKSLCLFYVDIDHFKEINDTFGHLAGDTTLETVAERLTALLPAGSIIGRLAGDEFAVIVDQFENGDLARPKLDKLARILLDRLADPFYVQGHEVFMTASMGIAWYPEDAPNVIDLIRNADAALYQAKKDGGNIFAHYAPAMNEASVERLMTKSKLKRAFERNELLVRYQPKYNLETGEVYGAEALVRWELPERGIILPSDFIPIAEETNLIIEIGEWVLDRVCEDFRYWQRSISAPGRVSVNLSLKQLRQPHFINRISSILRSYQVSPTSLELEITETTLMENPTRTIKLLDELYSLGLHLAIDDFGTGYSSLSALQQFPISTLKIDQSFVRDAAVNADDATIVGTIIHMGKSLQMDVVAEGVETEEQLNFLQTLQCTYVQGLLFGEPMSSDDYLELLLAQAEGTDTHRALFA
jgi:diguanylate cyclase (GGDEF)-like protein/PAS domain S-box-containing protein